MRNTVIQIAESLGHEVVEKNLIRADLYLADEVFMCGTAAEVTPLRAIDGVELGVGPVTETLRGEYLRCVRGTTVYSPAWLEHVTLELAA
jgi:branched-chain amino acid aminotransferase